MSRLSLAKSTASCSWWVHSCSHPLSEGTSSAATAMTVTPVYGRVPCSCGREGSAKQATSYQSPSAAAATPAAATPSNAPAAGWLPAPADLAALMDDAWSSSPLRRRGTASVLRLAAMLGTSTAAPTLDSYTPMPYASAAQHHAKSAAESRDSHRSVIAIDRPPTWLGPSQQCSLACASARKHDSPGPESKPEAGAALMSGPTGSAARQQADPVRTMARSGACIQPPPDGAQEATGSAAASAQQGRLPVDVQIECGRSKTGKSKAGLSSGRFRVASDMVVPVLARGSKAAAVVPYEVLSLDPTSQLGVHEFCLLRWRRTSPSQRRGGLCLVACGRCLAKCRHRHQDAGK